MNIRALIDSEAFDNSLFSASAIIGREIDESYELIIWISVVLYNLMRRYVTCQTGPALLKLAHMRLCVTGLC